MKFVNGIITITDVNGNVLLTSNKTKIDCLDSRNYHRYFVMMKIFCDIKEYDNVSAACSIDTAKTLETFLLGQFVEVDIRQLQRSYDFRTWYLVDEDDKFCGIEVAFYCHIDSGS